MFRVDLVLRKIRIKRLDIVVVPVPYLLSLVRKFQFLVTAAELKVGIGMQGIQFDSPLEKVTAVLVTADEPTLLTLVHVGHPHGIPVFRVSRVQLYSFAHRLPCIESSIGHAHVYESQAHVSGCPEPVSADHLLECLERFVVSVQCVECHAEPVLSARGFPILFYHLNKQWKGFSVPVQFVETFALFQQRRILRHYVRRHCVRRRRVRRHCVRRHRSDLWGE